MFTGIVEELGRVEFIESLPDSARLGVRGPLVCSDASHGDSIAVNGVCLTVTESDGSVFVADVMAETLARTSLGSRAPGSPVNLERALRADARLGGHIVQGHVDGVGRLLAITPGERWTVVRVGIDTSLAGYLAEKGSIAVDGVSLTVSAVSSPSADAAWFEVSLIPTTLDLTTLGLAGVGDPVNLEVDVLAKYVARLVASGSIAAPPEGSDPGPPIGRDRGLFGAAEADPDPDAGSPVHAPQVPAAPLTNPPATVQETLR